MLQETANLGLLLIISGPAGSGKTTLCDRILKDFHPQIQRVITATTRPPRKGEKNGVDYHFLNPESFSAHEKANDFYETAEVYNHHYGSLKSAIREKLTQETDLLLNIDVQGAASFRKAAQDDSLLKGRLISVFLMPPSMEELHSRMTKRGLDDPAIIQKRLKTAAQ